MDTPTFFLGAFIYPRNSTEPSDEVMPVMAEVKADTPHLAKRMLALDVLRHGYYVKSIRQLTDHFPPFDEQEWEIR